MTSIQFKMKGMVNIFFKGAGTKQKQKGKI